MNSNAYKEAQLCDGDQISNLSPALELPTARTRPINKQKLKAAQAAGVAKQGSIMLKAISAVAAAAIVAGSVVLFPGLSPRVEASSAPMVKADRADAAPLTTACSQRTWPYIEAACLRDARNPQSEAHEVRFIALDRLPLPAGMMAAR
jgi:hypothetical protein